jgi:hypothetical protein
VDASRPPRIARLSSGRVARTMPLSGFPAMVATSRGPSCTEGRMEGRRVCAAPGLLAVASQPRKPSPKRFAMSHSSRPVRLRTSRESTSSPDAACADLIREAGTRTFAATVVPGGRPGSFLARLSAARFSPKCQAGHIPESCATELAIGMVGDDAGIWVGIVEQLTETTYLMVDARAQGAFDHTGIRAPLHALSRIVRARGF